MAFNSMSSRSFRERLLKHSIMEFFNAPKKQLESKNPSLQPGPPIPSNPQQLNSLVIPDIASTDGQTETRDTGIELSETPKSTSSTPKKEVGDAHSLDTGDSPREGEIATLRARTNALITENEGDSEYKKMMWWQAGMVMVAETVSLGILALPQTLSTLGMIPGVLLLLVLGIMASYTGYVIGQFKIVHPHIHSMADAGETLFGWWGYVILGLGQLTFFIFVMASHILTFGIMMNVITDHATCTIVFMLMGTALSLLITLPRTLRHLSYYSISSFMSIIAAVIATIIGVSILKPGFRTVNGAMVHDLRLWPQPNTKFHTAFVAGANMVFAYSGHVAFFAFISEMKKPKEFPKALAFLQISDISMYLISAIIIYYFAGNAVASPALDSAGPLVRKIAYGFAIPTIVIAGVVNANVALKFQYALTSRFTHGHLANNNKLVPRRYWILSCLLLWTIAWLIAESVPRFNDLLGITSALFASWFTFGLSGIFWCHMNLKKDSQGGCWWKKIAPRTIWNWKKTLLLILNILNILLGLMICIIGLYAGIKSISISTNTQKPFSCADNSASKLAEKR